MTPNLAGCHGGDCDLCDLSSCPCPHHAEDAVIGAVWELCQTAGHLDCGGWQMALGGAITCRCGEVLKESQEVTP